MQDRDEHLAWCKRRALDYLDRGEIREAITSMLSDLNKHPQLGCNPYLAMVGMMAARDLDVGAARRFIEGFR